MAQGVLVIAEQSDGVFRKVTFEALSEARRIADGLGTGVTAVAMGAGIENAAAELANYGADRIIVADDDCLADYLNDVYTHVTHTIVAKEDPQVVVIGATSQGKDLAARLAARLDAPLGMDCVGVRLDGGELSVTRSIYGGKILADVALCGDPAILAIRPNAFAVNLSEGAGNLEPVSVEPGESTQVLVDKQLDTSKVELTEAEVVVSGGRGMGGPDYSLLEALAASVNGAVGASRSAVDEGWRPASDQVGQTGKTVSPSLYIACGISGAIQHLAGMSSSKVVVAINKDPEAPIFSKADYGIAGDLFEIVPLITQELKKLNG